jgi:hypothetical protein
VEKQLTPKRVGYTTSSMTGSMATSARTRQLVPGSDVRTVDSGCGGMAGLFGYEEGHYEVSMKMGERRLFPAVREAEGRVIRPRNLLSRADPGRHRTAGSSSRTVPGRTSERRLSKG